jgi:hypothetical protein
MERDFYTDEFEQLIREKSDQFRMYPSKRVWHSIYNNLHPSRRWPSFVISILFLTSLVSIGYLNTSDNAAKNVLTAGKTPSTDIHKKAIIVSTGNINTPDYSYISTPVAYAANTNAAPDSRITQPGGDDVTGTEYLNTIESNTSAQNKKQDLIQSVTEYIYSNQLFTDINSVNKKNTAKTAVNGVQKNAEPQSEEEGEEIININSKVGVGLMNPVPESVTADADKSKAEVESSPKNKPAIVADKNEEKAWIENFALHNKSARSQWKNRMSFVFYATPAVNYRKLSTESKGSNAPFATTGDINKAISQKPGLGIETGIGMSYAFTKNFRLKAGVQFNYTNYNINADQTAHPIQTTILLTDPATGFSYPAPRTSTIANTYDNSALQPVTLHNRTYQVSIPIGLAYKLSSNKNVEWFLGATAQPSYIFGGKAHLISSDLKNYVSDPSSIRSWNLNIGIETYMTYKLGSYSLQVGPQVRYQVYSTYRKDIALIEKPYAVGLKMGIIKGF